MSKFKVRYNHKNFCTVKVWSSIRRTLFLRSVDNPSNSYCRILKSFAKHHTKWFVLQQTFSTTMDHVQVACHSEYRLSRHLMFVKQYYLRSFTFKVWSLILYICTLWRSSLSIECHFKIKWLLKNQYWIHFKRLWKQLGSEHSKICKKTKLVPPESLAVTSMLKFMLYWYTLYFDQCSLYVRGPFFVDTIL